MQRAWVSYHVWLESDARFDVNTTKLCILYIYVNTCNLFREIIGPAEMSYRQSSSKEAVAQEVEGE